MHRLYLVDIDTVKTEIRTYMKRCLNPSESEIIEIINRNTFTTGEEK